MKGDRVQIVSNMMHINKDEVVHVYAPVTNPDGSLQQTYDGFGVVKSMGGVKTGSTGVIQGDGLKVHRLQMHHLQNQGASLGGNETVVVFPVFLDAYQQIGWFPSDHLKVVSGGTLR